MQQFIVVGGGKANHFVLVRYDVGVHAGVGDLVPPA
jgi:hypothetical protein